MIGVLRFLLGAFALACVVAPAAAHDGPPYPIFVDEPVAEYSLSIWVDPDVGVGTFYYYVEALEGHDPDAVRVRLFSEPEDGASPPVEGVSEIAEPDEPFQQIGTLEFHHRGQWPTRFVIERAADPAVVLGELRYALDVTPPGLGWVDIIWFAFPFLALAGLWLKVLLAQRAHDRSANTATTST